MVTVGYGDFSGSQRTSELLFSMLVEVKFLFNSSFLFTNMENIVSRSICLCLFNGKH